MANGKLIPFKRVCVKPVHYCDYPSKTPELPFVEFCYIVLYSSNWSHGSFLLQAIVLVWFVLMCIHTLQSSTRLDRKSLEPWENNTWEQGRGSCSSSQSLIEEGEWPLSSCANSQLMQYTILWIRCDVLFSVSVCTSLFTVCSYTPFLPLICLFALLKP